MADVKPRDPDFEPRIRRSFARQALMNTFGATLSIVEAGHVTIDLPFDQKLTQQHGFLHGGVTAALLDTACGFSAVTLMPPGSGILTIEFKTNFLAPGSGRLFRFSADVLKPGRSITVAEARAHAIRDEGETLIATMTATMMSVHNRDHIKD